jgi:hypothetical protein
MGKMKLTASPAEPATKTTQPASDPLNLLKRIKLEFLDECVCERRGYDPYDTSKARAPDVWAAKRKRA